MSETLKEKESKFFEFLKTLSPSEKTHMRTYLNEVSWRHHWRKHFKNISKIRSDWRRKMLPKANLLKVLKKMEKMSSHNALSARRGSGGGGGGRKLKTQRLKRKSKKMQNK
jgi:hypothetical protein